MAVIIESDYNVYIKERIFSEIGIDHSSNGGYNVFKIFIDAYLPVWKEYGNKVGIGLFLYEREKFRLFKGLVIPCVYKLIFKNQPGNFTTEHAWYYLFKYYWYLPYFYIYLIAYFFKAKIVSLLKSDAK
jgi:hypothetical protein